eukprot:GHVP01061727.1.p1 GENE.GHVP01061727.1~~GHVP01061727.1.p1  ORF type:complete len:191 (-),score=32.34 GHVP01061727.1:75-599(-)
MTSNTAADGVPSSASVTLKSKEKEFITVDVEVAAMSGFVKNMIEATGVQEEIPLPNVSTAILEKIVLYCNYHKDAPPEEIQKPLKSNDFREAVSQWDYDFINLPNDEIFEIILAANYMDIKPLLELACGKIASKIKGKSVEEIRRIFNITNDFTKEEEAQVLEENRWCEEAHQL